jgi:nicotinamide-nucleotide amidase
MPAAEIIAIGTELLLGETADTNTRTIARVLRSLGIDLFHTQTIGDNSARITETVRQTLKRADIVITTGGIGPTVDDPTRQAVADSVGVVLEFHPELWEQIIAQIALYGRTPTENQKRQAYIPKNAIIIENPIGTAPAFIMEIPHHPSVGKPRVRSKVIISLPGVPHEMENLLTTTVVPYLKKHFDLKDVLKIRTLHVSGLGEGMVDNQIGDLEILSNPTVGLTAHSGIVDIRIAAKVTSESEANRMIASVERDLRSRLGDDIFGADEDTLESVALKAIALKGWTLACLEVNLEGKLLTRIAHSGHPAYLGGRISKMQPEELTAGTESIRQQFNASTALGVAYSQDIEKQNIHITLVTPVGETRRNLSYGGYPGNARRWAVNMALDGLRRSAQEQV